jgi:hypothetical protein
MSTEIEQVMSTEIEQQSFAELAAEKFREQVSIEDLAVPRLFVGQPTSRAVVDHNVPLGAIYLASAASDPDPVVLYKPNQKKGVVVHLLGYARVVIYHDDDGSFRVVPQGSAGVPHEADGGYQLMLLIPAFDDGMPVSGLFKSSGAAAAKTIITIAARSGLAPWCTAFELTTQQRRNELGTWHVPIAKAVEAQPAHVEAAETLAQLIGIGRAQAEICSPAEADDDSDLPWE